MDRNRKEAPDHGKGSPTIGPSPHLREKLPISHEINADVGQGSSLSIGNAHREQFIGERLIVYTLISRCVESKRPQKSEDEKYKPACPWTASAGP
jgi:hypothetical protein